MELQLLQGRTDRLIRLPHVGGPFREGLEIYNRAKEFGTNAHLGQMYGTHPHTYHLDKVEKVLIRFDFCSFRLRASAWLHDTVEDSMVTIEDIRKEFPGLVTSLVEAVTNAPGKTRKERNPATYQKIKQVFYAIILKLADRIANVEEAIFTKDSRLSMYQKEHAEFRAVLYQPGNTDAMWAHLDGLLIEQPTTGLDRLAQELASQNEVSRENAHLLK